MKRCAPSHINKYCYIYQNEKIYKLLSEKYEDEYTFLYKIRCSCNNTKFKVYRNEQSTVMLKCPVCKNKIVVYDLSYYPGATKIGNNIELEKIIYKEQELFDVYVLYEYDDEFEQENDVEFNNNSISWCYAYILSNEGLIQILNDETT